MGKYVGQQQTATFFTSLLLLPVLLLVTKSGISEAQFYDSTPLPCTLAFCVDRANGRVGIGTTAPANLVTIVGTQPASVSSTPGTTSNITGRFSFLGAAGGDTTIATTGVGGPAGGFQFIGGAGGTALSAATNSTTGGGGSVVMTPGTSPANSVSTTGSTKSGSAGGFTMIISPSGAVSGSTALSQSGAGGAVSLSVLGSGSATGTGTSNTTGFGGSVSIAAGAAGAATGAASGTNTGGNGGLLTLGSGAGGTANSATTANNGGNGGAVLITAGVGGVGTTANGTDGTLTLKQGGVNALVFASPIARGTLGGPVTLKGYTVATLPAGVQGDTAFVTDALAPAFLAVLVGGGAVVTPCFYNGAAWVGY